MQNEHYPPLTLEERNFLAIYGFEVCRFNKWGIAVRKNGYAINVFDRQRPIEDWIEMVKRAKQE